MKHLFWAYGQSVRLWLIVDCICKLLSWTCVIREDQFVTLLLASQVIETSVAYCTSTSICGIHVVSGYCTSDKLGVDLCGLMCAMCYVLCEYRTPGLILTQP
jgi:hypothetical protein